MTEVRTYGRWPTVGEVMEYYSRKDILAFLYEMSRRRKVAFIFPTAQHWEQNWRRDRVDVSNESLLLHFIEKRIYRRTARDTSDRRLDFYPSFHTDVRRHDPLFSDRREDLVAYDFLFESDLLPWRRCFEDLSGVIAALDRFGVPYLLKFSGHRSLHLMICGEAFMESNGGHRFIQPLDEVDTLLKRLIAANASRAHKTEITRLPYSLNEDTGLVCLPLDPAELDGFRPWHASIYAVEGADERWLPIPEEMYGKGVALLRALSASADGDHEVVYPKKSLRGSSTAFDNPPRELPNLSDEQCLEDLRSRDDRIRARAVRALMATDAPVPFEALRDVTTADHPDVRWFAAEVVGRRSFLEKWELAAGIAEDSDQYAHEAAIRLFRDLGDRATGVLEELFRKPLACSAAGEEARANISEGAGERRSSRAYAFRIKRGALRALTELGDRRAIPKALDLLEGPALGVSDAERAHLLVLLLNVGEDEVGGGGWNDHIASVLLAIADHAAPAFAELIREKEDVWGLTSVHEALIEGLTSNETFVRELVPLVSAMLDEDDLPLLSRAFWWMRWIFQMPCGEGLLEQDQALAEDLVGRLRTFQHHSKKSIRRAIVSTLCGIPSRNAIAAAVDMLDDPAESVRRKAAGWLGRIMDDHPEALEGVIRRLQKERKRPVKDRIVWALAGHNTLPRAVEGLFIALSDPNRQTRLQALDALADTDQADEAIQIALNDRSLKVQRRAKVLLETTKAGER